MPDCLQMKHSSRRTLPAALLIIAAVSLAPRPSAAQIEALPVIEENILAGQVTDQAGRPLAGARVHLPGRQRSTLTDANGNYRLSGLVHGRARVVITRLGCEPAVHDIRIRGLTSFDVRLQTTAFAISPVLVTATRSPIAPMETPLPSATLFGERLQRHQTVSLSHAIDVLPGVRTRSTGGQIGSPVIRGLGGPRVLVLDDGGRLEDYSWGDWNADDGPPVEARQVERVEVVRGPGAVLYGADALGGVVNAVPAELPEARAGLVEHVALEVYGATNNHELGTAVRAEGGTPRLGWRLHAIGRGGGDLRTPEGALANTGFGAFNGEAAGGVRGTTGSLTLRYVRYGGEFEVLEDGTRDTSGATPGVERHLADDRVQLGAEYLVSGLRLEARGQWERHKLAEFIDDSTLVPGTIQKVEQYDLALSTSSLELLAHHDGKRLRGTVGLSGMSQENDSRGPLALVPDAHVVAGGAFVFEQYTRGRWSLLAGIRQDLRHLDADGNSDLRMPAQQRDDASLSGDVGVVFHPVETVACGANLGRSWRAPVLFELFANGPRRGKGWWEIGDPGLDEERGLMADLSLRWQSPRFRGEVAAFRNRLDGTIQLVPTGETRPSGGDSLPVYRYAQTDAVLWGGEARAEYEIVRGLTLQGTCEAVRGDDTGADTPLALVPPLHAFVGATYRFREHGRIQDANVGGAVEMVAAQDRTGRFETPTAGYALLHLEGGIEWMWSGRTLAVDVQLRNALDTAYRDHLSRYKDFAPDPGRNLLVRLSTGF